MKSILKEIKCSLSDLDNLLFNDKNFTFCIGEGGYISKDGVVFIVSRSPYNGCLFAYNDEAEKSIEKWAAYIIEKSNTITIAAATI